MSALASAIMVALEKGLSPEQVYSALMWDYSLSDMAAASNEILNHVNEGEFDER
jgi:hypothetical protein